MAGGVKPNTGLHFVPRYWVHDAMPPISCVDVAWCLIISQRALPSTRHLS